jgi:transcriptional regulator with XRE-family HTH domain
MRGSISQVERGLKAPSIAALPRLVETLDVSVARWRTLILASNGQTMRYICFVECVSQRIREAALTAPLSVAVTPRWLKHQTTLANGAPFSIKMRTHTSLK